MAFNSVASVGVESLGSASQGLLLIGVVLSFAVACVAVVQVVFVGHGWVSGAGLKWWSRWSQAVGVSGAVLSCLRTWVCSVGDALGGAVACVLCACVVVYFSGSGVCLGCGSLALCVLGAMLSVVAISLGAMSVLGCGVVLVCWVVQVSRSSLASLGSVLLACGIACLVLCLVACSCGSVG